MTARLLHGKPVAEAIWGDVERRTEGILARRGAPPSLAIVLATDDPAAAAYLRQIERAFGRHGLATRRDVLATPDRTNLAACLSRLGDDPSVDGVLLTTPLPSPLTLQDAAALLPPSKDVEGLHPEHAGRLAQGGPSVVPSTPLAGMEILRAAGFELRGKTAVVIGRSAVVGRPLAHLLLLADATLVVCHTRTPDIGAWTRRADVLLLAAGRPGLVDATMVRPEAVVVDFGINVVGDQIVGDAAPNVGDVVAAITPVPGGVGPVTTAVLARNLVDLTEAQAS
ncbi:MAG: bifunctional 5,10-methylenetetrahydrofolate dehydrogenase/5,10-methenyltetrahydrofolate cyclohydrolase [Chloroflexi bacterium]|nr:bifunctional 5,10-methylenetetrahydrofolate dehydrogenase/5,10-methenyltetrahydrofolate cyclohydrolase [Chloroflexota bacterium]